MEKDPGTSPHQKAGEDLRLPKEGSGRKKAAKFLPSPVIEKKVLHLRPLFEKKEPGVREGGQFPEGGGQKDPVFPGRRIKQNPVEHCCLLALDQNRFRPGAVIPQNDFDGIGAWKEVMQRGRSLAGKALAPHLNGGARWRGGKMNHSRLDDPRFRPRPVKIPEGIQDRQRTQENVEGQKKIEKDLSQLFHL